MVPTFGGFENQLRAVFGICYPSSSENHINPHPPIAPITPKVEMDDGMHVQDIVS